MKKTIVLSLTFSFFLLLFSGCVSTRQLEETPSSKDPQNTNSMFVKPDGSLDANYNQYHISTASDGKYVFYTELSGIYKIPVDGNRAQKILSGEAIRALTLHNSTIYYVDGFHLCKADKDGCNQTTIETDVETRNIVQVLCLQDTLHISNLNLNNRAIDYFSCDIKSDPKKIELNELSFGFPTSNGTYYKIDSLPHVEKSYAIYRKSPSGKEEILIDSIDNHKYIITEQYIFYSHDAGIWRCNQDGQGKRKIADAQNIETFRFVNYDGEWIYCSDHKTVFRLNQNTGEKEEYPAWHSSSFDIVNNYLYGYANKKKIRMNVTGRNVEYSPFP